MSPGNSADVNVSPDPGEQTVETGAAKDSRRLLQPLLATMVIAAVAIGAVMLLAPFERETVGGLTLMLLLLLIALGLPVGIAMLIAGGAGIYALGDLMAVSASVKAIAWNGVASWTLSVVPMFLLMGLAVWHGGMATKAFTAAERWGGRIPGGLAVATTGAGAGLSAASGSTMAITLALGRMSIPEMLKAEYQPALAVGSVAMAGSLGQIIPPSILLVVYAGVAQTPVGPQITAGIVPGLLLALLFWALIIGRSLLSPSLAPTRGERVSWSMKIRALVDVLPLIVVVLVVLGGMYQGWFTPTEAGAVGALLTLGYCLLRPAQLRAGAASCFRLLKSISVETTSTTASVFLMIVGSLVLSRAFALTGVAQGFSEWLVGLDLSRTSLLLSLIIVYIVLGMFLESLPMMLLTVPLLQAPLEASGVDMIWFGVFLILLCEIGMVFPPVGLLTFVVHRLCQEPRVNLGVPISLGTAFRGVMPFVAVVLAFLVLTIAFPSVITWLPDSMQSP